MDDNELYALVWKCLAAIVMTIAVCIALTVMLRDMRDNETEQLRISLRPGCKPSPTPVTVESPR